MIPIFPCIARWQFGFWFDKFNGAFNEVLEAIDDSQRKSIVIKGGNPPLGTRGWLLCGNGKALSLVAVGRIYDCMSLHFCN